MTKPLAVMDQRVAMGDVDAARIIYFAAPQRWQEALFTQWLQQIGRPLVGLIDAGYAVPTVAVKADYHSPLRLDDWVSLELYANHIGRTSFSVRCEMFRRSDSALCVRVTTWHVWARVPASGSETVQPLPLPDWLRSALVGAADD